MTVLYTRWRFENYKNGQIYIAKKNHEKARETLFTYRLHSKKILKKLVKLCIHLGCIVKNSFHFDEIFFMENFQTSKFQF